MSHRMFGKQKEAMFVPAWQPMILLVVSATTHTIERLMARNLFELLLVLSQTSKMDRVLASAFADRRQVANYTAVSLA